MQHRPRGELVIDGSHGEGGGQILRTAVSIAVITGQAVRLTNIRATRPRPGLAAQHITSVRAAAAICNAEIAGDTLGSTSLSFRPRAEVRADQYRFDVAEAREGGSAGSVNLILQTVLLPLSFAEGPSEVTILGGTHVPWSPSFDYLADVWLPTLARVGIDAQAELVRSGWFPKGNGELRGKVHGLGRGAKQWLGPLQATERGRLEMVTGRAIAAGLHAHIAQRMADRATALLRQAGMSSDIRAKRFTSASPGAGLFLAARYEGIRCGFDAYGKRGVPSEEVAEAAVAAVLEHDRTDAALDAHLADQILLPLAFANAESRFTCQSITRHLETVAWLIESFGLARTRTETRTDGTGVVTVSPTSK